MAFEDIILKLSRQLYPTGRAFKMPYLGDFEKLHKALAKSESRTYVDALSILDSALPDNANFTVDDATDWERRYGLITNPLVSLDDRKLAIKRKMQFPGTIKARSNYRFLQRELQAAGFDVYVYENRFDDGMGGYDTQTPEAVSGVPYPGVRHGTIRHGNANHGGALRPVIANYIDETLDFSFNVGANLRSTFFIGGNPIGSFADVDVNRKEEFRQLVLRIKPVQTVAFLFINYV
jgi:uncharacterized protein YmfQ (DUF2313 family)